MFSIFDCKMKRKVILYFFILIPLFSFAQKKYSGYQVSSQADVTAWKTYIWESDEVNQLSIFDFFDPFLAFDSLTQMQQISFALNYELGLNGMRWIDGHVHTHDFIHFRFFIHQSGKSYSPVISSKGNSFVSEKLPSEAWIFEAWDDHSNQVLFRSWCIPNKLSTSYGANLYQVAARTLIYPFYLLRNKH